MGSEPQGPGVAPAWREIALSPIGGLPARDLEAVLAALSARVDLPCRPVAVPRQIPLATIPGRSQVDADRLLAHLEELAGSAPLVGVTGHDLALPIFTHVFGRARLGGRAAVVSLARLREPDVTGGAGSLLGRRAAAEILHELGHLAGLEHCAEPGCLMRFAATIEAADLRGGTFCASCAARLPAGLARRGADLGKRWLGEDLSRGS